MHKSDIKWSADKGEPTFDPEYGASVKLDFEKPFVKEDSADAKKVTVTAQYSGSAPVEDTPQTTDVDRIYLDFWIAETEESTDDVLIVRAKNTPLAVDDKKVIHWSKVIVKHDAPGKLPLELESSGTKKLYFYGEEQNPNELEEDPELKSELSKEFETEKWFWIGTDEKGTGEGKFKAKGDLGTGLKDAPEEKTVNLLPVEVAPDDDQPGKTGDQIPSNKGGAGEKHYVSPKKSVEIPDDFVVIKAKGVEKELFEQVLEWECVPAANGSVDPNDSTKYRVKRDATGKTAVKIKTKDGGQEVDLINVWVVWADTEVVQSLQNPVFGAGYYSGAGVTDPAKAWQFKFKIKPVELFSQNPAADLPKLDGSADSDPPGNGNPYFVTEHLNLTDESGDTAPFKWDVSRQVEIKVFNNPSGDQVPLAKFVQDYSFLKAGQPAAETNPILYPADAAQGNDDPNKQKGIPIKDENSDPYKAIAENNGLDHEIGEITSFDSPVFSPFVSEPASGSAMVQIANFREFARLEIKGGSTNQQNPTDWYRVSDYIDWHHVWAAIYGEKPPDSGNFTWVDSGSSSGNNVFTPPNE